MSKETIKITVEVINKEYPLGTVDGINYNVYPRGQFMEFRTLKADEIECRVAQVTEKGASLLLYKDARADMKMLDEAKVKWQRKHEVINGKLFCTVSIWDAELKQWIDRQDVGVESNTEATKGEASDSFKRACFNWGIGRELYTAPSIWVFADKMNIQKTEWQGKTKYKTYDKFTVTNIRYNDNREIDGLVIVNEKTKAIVYKLGV